MSVELLLHIADLHTHMHKHIHMYTAMDINLLRENINGLCLCDACFNKKHMLPFISL